MLFRSITGVFDEKHLAFEGLSDFTEQFKIKHKKVEIDEMMAKLREAYGGK